MVRTLFRVGVVLLMSAIVSSNIAVAHDDDEPGPGSQLTPEELKRARVLFRNYCMDCHGPKMTGDEYDENLLCPDVQGDDQEEYQEAMLEGPDEMPRFRVMSLSGTSDGYLVISYEDFLLMTQHESTFRPSQP